MVNTRRLKRSEPGREPPPNHNTRRNRRRFSQHRRRAARNGTKKTSKVANWTVFTDHAPVEYTIRATKLWVKKARHAKQQKPHLARMHGNSKEAYIQSSSFQSITVV